MIPPIFQGLKPYYYKLIMADPPWNFLTYSDKTGGKSARDHYEVMTLDDIKAMPVSQLAHKDCLLWLWACNPMLPQAFEVMDAWGFDFVTAGHWVKKTKNNKLAFGTGYVLRCAGEPFLIGKRRGGKPKTTKGVRSVIEGPLREHSRKPDEAFEAASQLVPTNRKLELFSRQERDGWDVWGDEVKKFC